MITISANGLTFKQLNEKIKKAIREGVTEIKLKNVNGQRYIGDGLKNQVNIEISGTPGNDLGAFMDGATIIVHNNACDGVGNTMNSGLIVVEGDARDIIGYGMRGGKIFIKGNVGYRVGIHMKEYQDKVPIIVAGGSAKDFLGEYMAGGILLLLGLPQYVNDELAGNFIGTGMHGGVIYIRGKVEEHKLGLGAKFGELTEGDIAKLKELVEEYCKYFSAKVEEIINDLTNFTKIIPVSHRPYGKMYTHYTTE